MSDLAEEFGTVDVPMAGVRAGIFQNVVSLPRSGMALVLGVGQLSESEKDVLLPLIETRIHGVSSQAGSDQPAVLFSETLTLEGAACLLADLAEDMSQICRQIGEMTGGTLSIEPKRLELARNFLRSAISSASVGISALETSLPT